MSNENVVDSIGMWDTINDVSYCAVVKLPMFRYLAFPLIIQLLFLPSCSAGVVDLQKALALGDVFMSDIIDDRRDEIYLKMEPEFHDLTSRDQFVSGLDNLYGQVGRPTAFELASYYGKGVRTITGGPHAGQTKPTCEIIYNVTTTKGVYPLKVQIVNSKDGLAVTRFSFQLAN